MRIFAIGDPHGAVEVVRKIPIKDIDLILLTGDIGKADLARKRFFENAERKQQGLPALKEDAKFLKAVHIEVGKSTLEVLRYLSRYAPVYAIQGNVGIPGTSEVREENERYGLKLDSIQAKIASLGNVFIVKNRLRLLDGLRAGFLDNFTDTSWVREFHPRDYSKVMKKAAKQTALARRVLNRFGRNLDVLICHQPPFGLLDKVNFPGAPKNWQGKYAGSKVILDYIRKYQPKYVFCGHIHEGKGVAKVGKTLVYNLGVAGYKLVELN